MATQVHCDRCHGFGDIGVRSSTERISVPPDGREHYMLTISATFVGKAEDGSLTRSEPLDLCESCWQIVAALRYEGL